MFKIILLFLSLILFNNKLFAKDVYWGGVAFVSVDQSQNEMQNKLYPYLMEIGYDKLDNWAYNSLISNNSFKNFSIKVASNGSPLRIESGNEDNAVIMSVVFFADDTFFGKDITAHGDVSFDNIFHIYGSLVFFDPENGAYINSMPLIKQLTFSQKSKPNPNQIKNEFIKMLDSSSSNNYFKQLFNRASNIKLEFEREKLASFGEVKFGPSVNQFFSRTNEVETWKFRINKQYENLLSMFSKIPIVPSGPNAELKYFNAKFKDKEVKIEILDETIYVFNVNLKIFKKVDKPNKNNTFRTVCHIVGLRLSLIADGEDKIMDVPFVRAKKSCGVVGANNLIDDDYYFPMNLLIVIEKSASQFRSINPNYLKIATQGKTEQAILQINNAKKELFN